MTRTRHCGALRSLRAPARRPAIWGPTAPANPPPSRSSPVCCARQPARCASAAMTSPSPRSRPNAAPSLRRILERMLSRGKTLLFCSHILEVIERLCTRVVVIDQGEIVADDTTSNLLQQTLGGTLEAVFQQLTRPEKAGDGDRAL